VILLGELAIRGGRLEEAQIWIDRLDQMIAGDPVYATAIQGGYYSTAAELALASHRWDDAEALVERAREVYPAIAAARFSAIALSIRVRAQLGRTGRLVTKDILLTLQALYARGRHLGMQDEVVEALWLAEFMAGRSNSASSLLSDYVTIYKRETGPVNWSLKRTSGSDRAWDTIEPPLTDQ
jgi:hypothetical protein